MKKYFLIVVMCFLFNEYFCFCTSKEKKCGPRRTNQIFKDSVIKDIPKYYEQAHIKKEKKEFENLIGLPSLEEGFNGEQVRIWGGNSRSDTLLLLMITSFDSIYSARLYTVKYQRNEKNDSLVALKNTIVSKSPKSGWKFFIDSLYKLQIFTLSDYSIIPGYNLPMDSDGPTIEVANAKVYRIYSLPSPNENKNEIWQAAKVLQIIKIVEDELQLKWL